MTPSDQAEAIAAMHRHDNAIRRREARNIHAGLVALATLIAIAATIVTVAALRAL